MAALRCERDASQGTLNDEVIKRLDFHRHLYEASGCTTLFEFSLRIVVLPFLVYLRVCGKHHRDCLLLRVFCSPLFGLMQSTKK
jgi:hypothetical protein